MRVQFTALLKEYKTKTTADLAKTTRVVADTEELIAKSLDEIKPDQTVRITVETE